MGKILVTGGAGFIGSNLVDKLLSENQEVIVLDNFDTFYSRKTKEDNLRSAQKSSLFKLIEGDIRDKYLLKEIFYQNRIETVIHIAAKAGVRPSIENPYEYYDINVNGTLNILETMKEARVNKMVFASSSSVYGNNISIPFKEDDIVDFPISPYASTKKSAELLCHVYSHLYNLDISCLRFFTVFGPRQRPDLAIHKFTKLIHKDLAIPFFGNGSTSRDYTYVDDIVDGILSACKNLKGYNIYNLGGSNPVSLIDLVFKIANLLGKEPILDKRPMQAGDVNLTYGCIQKAQEELNYYPKVSIDKGLSYFIEWYLQKTLVYA